MEKIFGILGKLGLGAISFLFVIGLFGGLLGGLPGIINAETVTYTYDPNGQLIKADYGGGNTITYAYDEAGNIVALTATGQAQKYTLTVSKSGDGSGTVTSNPAGINCGTDCDQAYDPNTGVSLTATASSGSTFVGWSGACSGKGACSVTMNGDKTVVATFNQQASQQYSLTVERTGTGDGTVTSGPAGIACGSTTARLIRK